jgi:tripeptidyl-peptidase-1
MYLLTSLSLFSLCFSGLAAPSSHHFVRHEKRDSTPHKLIRRGSAPLDTKLPIRFSLKHRNAHLGHDHLMDISDPRSPNFGKHWTAKQVEDFFSPSRESVKSVLDWLNSSGIHHSRYRVANGRGSVQLYATVSEAEALLNTKYYVYEDVETGDLRYACDEYSLHYSLLEHVDYVTPTVGFATTGSHKKLRKRGQQEIPKPRFTPYHGPPIIPGDLSNCSNAVTPDCVRGKEGLVSMPKIYDV